jgi:hypothetical protein
MASFSPPGLNLQYACITSKDDAVIAALVSSYFNDPGTYFILLTFPKLETPYAETIDFQKDDYFAHLMGTQAAARINNVIARLRPSKAFLAGLNESQKSYIRAYLPDHMIVELDTIDVVQRSLASLTHKDFDGFLGCRSSEVVQGLLLAKYANKRLSIDEAAPSLHAKHLGHGV